MIKDTIEKVQNLFRARAHAYRMVFDPKNVYTKKVLKDLTRFCRAHESTFSPDARMHAVLEGRREVIQRILDHLHLTYEELYELHKVKEMTGDKK